MERTYPGCKTGYRNLLPPGDANCRSAAGYLVAATPTAGSAWNTEMLIDTVRETLWLAKIRSVDGALLTALRPLLPAICLTGNTANETVSTNFLTSIIAEPALVKA